MKFFYKGIVGAELENPETDAENQYFASLGYLRIHSKGIPLTKMTLLNSKTMKAVLSHLKNKGLSNKAAIKEVQKETAAFFDEYQETITFQKTPVLRWGWYEKFNPRKSWVFWASDNSQKELSRVTDLYLEFLSKRFDGSFSKHSDDLKRRFHVSLWNTTGSQFDSVA